MVFFFSHTEGIGILGTCPTVVYKEHFREKYCHNDHKAAAVLLTKADQELSSSLNNTTNVDFDFARSNAKIHTKLDTLSTS